MAKNEVLGRIKSYGMTNQMVTEDLLHIGKAFGYDLGHVPTGEKPVEQVYYPQFDAEVRKEAAAMGEHYEVFYCLEKVCTLQMSVALFVIGSDGIDFC